MEIKIDREEAKFLLDALGRSFLIQNQKLCDRYTKLSRKIEKAAEAEAIQNQNGARNGN